MYFAKALSFFAIAAVACAAAVQEPLHGVRDEMISILMGNHVSNHHKAMSECNKAQCWEACYQHGDAFGGHCSDDDKCVCSGPNPEIRPMNTCDSWSDCGTCWFYERCCFKEGGATSSEKGVCMCGSGGRESKCA